MCPDRQIISLYIDGELPSPWKEKLETHLDSCPACRNRLETYGTLRSVLKDDGNVPEEAKNRVRAALYGAASPYRAGFTLIKTGNNRGWARKISLPVPAAAAAAAVFIIVSVLAVRGLRPSVQVTVQETTTAAAGIGTDLQGIVPMADMNGVLQYLSSQDSGDYMIIRLPESRNFSSYGEPALLKAADYPGTSRRSAGSR